MKDKRICQVVQDLLPNYIEGLTSDDTNEYIEEHIEKCSECSKILDDMKSEIKSPEEKVDIKEINYLKKYKNKLKIFKTIVLAIILVFILIIARRMFILIDIQSKVSKYEIIDNCHIKAYWYYEDKISISETYIEKDKRKTHMEIISKNDYFEDNVYYYKDRQNIFSIRGNWEKMNKTMHNEQDYMLSDIKIKNDLKTENLMDFIIMSLTTRISSEKCNGKECYKIEFPKFYKDFDGATEYIEKETGLVIRYIDNVSIEGQNESQAAWLQEYKYEFNTVTDEDFIEPDISEYEVVENN